MGIPTQADRDIAEIKNAADLVVLSLSTLRHCGSRTSQYDKDRMRRVLQERLQDFCDFVIDMASQ